MKVSSQEEAYRAAEVLRARMVDTENTAVVLTLGEQGALMLTAMASERVAALSVEPIDTTGAGDAFCGALATALASGETLRPAVEFANAAGAAAVTVTGATPSMPTRAKIEHLLESKNKKSE